MSDSSDPDAIPTWSPPARLEDHPYKFTPVPRAAKRRDGWSSDRQHAFVWALARLPSVAKAARSVGMSARSPYRLRDAPGAEAFAQAWDDALEIGIHRARDTALDRATQGVEVPVLYRGVKVGTRIKHNDRLLLGVLFNGAAEAKGLLGHQRRIEERREADERLGGPPDWGPSAAEREAAYRESFARDLAAMEARRAPGVPEHRAPRVRSF